MGTLGLPLPNSDPPTLTLAPPRPSPPAKPPLSQPCEPCPAQLQPSPIHSPTPATPAYALEKATTPAPSQSHPSFQHPVPRQMPPTRAPKVPRTRPHQENKSPGSSRRGLWGRREAGAANAEGSELSPRKRKTRPTAHTSPLTLTANLTDRLVTMHTPHLLVHAKARVTNEHRHTQIGPYAYHTYSFSESTPKWDPAKSNTKIFSSNNYKPGLYSLQNAVCIIL